MKPMRRPVIIFAAVFVLVAAVAVNLALSRSASVPAPGIDVVLLRCTQTASDGAGSARTDSGSFGRPVFLDDSSCAAALTSLINKGYRFQAINGEDVFLYTMVKP